LVANWYSKGLGKRLADEHKLEGGPGKNITALRKSATEVHT
jgi:hypothetical protein